MRQPDLFGGTSGQPVRPPPYPQGEDRLLFALYPDGDTAERIVRLRTALRADLGLSGPPRPIDLLHITLRHVGDVVGPPPAMVEALLAALVDFAAPAFEITLDGVARFGGGALVLTASEAANPALVEFRRAMCARLDEAGAGWRRDTASFAPHLTLSYETRQVAPQGIEPIRWTARDFVLTHSLIGLTRHRALARFALA